MKRIVLMAVIAIAGFWGAARNGHAMAVFDGSNLAQNLISAQEAIKSTQNQIQMLRRRAEIS